ncbi:MAG: sugar phosphate isomerase/epimerase [Ramlibacter sp.]|nr:sugar phosphate isomerase/epimerase [Cryobacterium sp.]
MCFGFNGDKALDASLAAKGTSRRSLFRGAAGAAGALALTGGLVTSGLATAAQASEGTALTYGGGRKVQHDRISIQLYTLRAALGGSPGFDTVLTRLAQYGYEKVEMAGYYGRTAVQMRSFFDGLGIRASSSHDGISSSRAALHTKLENAATLGQGYVNVPYLNSDKLSDWQQWADQMNAEAVQAGKYGLAYGYHNHAHEFTIDLGGGLTPWEVFAERLDPKLVHLEADLYWVYTGGVNSGQDDPDQFAVDVVREAPQRVRQYHVKDRDALTGDMCDLGTGVVDFTRIFSSHTVEEYIVENDTPDVTPLTSAAVGHLYLDHVRF